jgi:lipopolysaccharide/colanic/teichoic acid biosynthesis glycosyltransferase
MRLMVIRDEGNATQTPEADILRYALSTRPLPEVVLNGAYHVCGSVDGRGGLSQWVGGTGPTNIVWVLPPSWPREAMESFGGQERRVLTHGFRFEHLGQVSNHPYFMISDGRCAAHISDDLSERVLATTSADAVAVAAAPDLLAYRERIRLTERGDLVGYRRLYRDSAEPVPLPTDWPHHFLIRSELAGQVLQDGLPRDFGELLHRCRACQAKIEAVSMAGSVIDLASPDGLLALSDLVMTHCPPRGAVRTTSFGRQAYAYGTDHRVADNARLIGPVLLGDGVCIESDAVVVGPSILCNGATIRRGATIDSSIVGAGATVQPQQAVHRCIMTASQETAASARTYGRGPILLSKKPLCPRRRSVFRTWPRFSYAGTFKRVVDVILASIVLILFAPVFPLIALAIKMNSPGPVFFKDRRQGLHGRPFDCFKFRTMRVGAADIQDKLRFVSEVDGPQFKMADDPRISAVGHFLRETYLDEIPQFFNVLCGQMSIVGPRPSPESENTLCPSWRDARLSVRPGITGLWQVYRTREPFRDFQEWIYYDTKYVQELSPCMDLCVCCSTFRKMVDNFIRQF